MGEAEGACGGTGSGVALLREASALIRIVGVGAWRVISGSTVADEILFSESLRLSYGTSTSDSYSNMSIHPTNHQKQKNSHHLLSLQQLNHRTQPNHRRIHGPLQVGIRFLGIDEIRDDFFEAQDEGGLVG